MPSSSQVMLVLLVPATLQTNVIEKLKKYWDSLIKVVDLCLAQEKASSLWLDFTYIVTLLLAIATSVQEFISLWGESLREDVSYSLKSLLPLSIVVKAQASGFPEKWLHFLAFLHLDMTLWLSCSQLYMGRSDVCNLGHALKGKDIF